MVEHQARSSNELANERTDLAIDRTAMGAGRTLLAWVRTALSMISFGFTIYKFLEATAKGGAVGMMRAGGPRRLGLFLIGLGVMCVITGTVEYFETIKRLNQLSPTPCKTVRFSLVLGSLIGLLGLFLFVTILVNREVF